MSYLQLSTELRWLVVMMILFSGNIFTDAKLVEVSTRPGISMLIAFTPCGQAYNTFKSALLVVLSITVWGTVSDSNSNRMDGSISPFSFSMSATYMLKSIRTFSFSEYGTQAIAIASRAIAFRKFPPSKLCNLKSISLFIFHKNRFRILFALPSPLSISSPE